MGSGSDQETREDWGGVIAVGEAAGPGGRSCSSAPPHAQDNSGLPCRSALDGPIAASKCNVMTLTQTPEHKKRTRQTTVHAVYTKVTRGGFTQQHCFKHANALSGH
jgi:hypothetical protein